MNLDVSFNKISQISISKNDLRKLPVWQKSGVKISCKVNIQNNSVYCGCEIYEFLNVIKEGNDKASFYIKDLSCHSPKKYKNTKLIDLDSKNYECKVQYQNFSKNDACAGVCDCWVRPFDNSTMIDCTNKGLSEVPELVSVKNASKIQLLLGSNAIKEFPDIWQPGFNKIELLDFSNNQITEFDDDILNFSIKVESYFIL